MPNIGPVELIIVLVIVLVIFGARRVPEAGKNLGKGMREFKEAITGREDRKGLEASNDPQTSGQATAPPEQAAPAVQEPPPAPAAAPAPPQDAEQAPERETARSGEPRG
jgi:sec-independent protein translocase protein TatA